MKRQYGFIFVVMVLLVMLGPGNLYAEDIEGMKGWGINDEYNALYDANDVEQVKGIVTDIIEVVPLEGMSPAVCLVVKEDEDSEGILVHLCPVGYKNTSRLDVRKGDKISLRGHYAEINGEDVIMAAKVKNKGKSYKFRLTSDGTPFWAMSPAQLKKELLSE